MRAAHDAVVHRRPPWRDGRVGKVEEGAARGALVRKHLVEQRSQPHEDGQGLRRPPTRGRGRRAGERNWDGGGVGPGARRGWG